MPRAYNLTVGPIPPTLMGGYYKSNNGNILADTAAMNLRSFTQYRTLQDGSGLPGWAPDFAYLNDLIDDDVMGVFVVENKQYTANVSQSFSIVDDGVTYNYTTGAGKAVPAANMTVYFPITANFYGYEQITSGACDGLIHRYLLTTRSMPDKPWVWSLGSELDTYHQGFDGGGVVGTTEAGVDYTWAESDARALDAYTYIVNWLRDPPGAIAPIGDNVKFVLGVGGWSETSWVRLHPESFMPYVDYVNMNVYRTSAGHTAAQRFARTFDYRTNGSGPLAKAKPFLVTEWGARTSLGGQAAWIATVPAAINGINAGRPVGTGPIAGPLNYFNSSTDGALSPLQDGLDALAAIYAAPPFA